MIARLATITVVIVMLVALVGVATPAPASAACGTAWKSKVEPPEDILVYRTGTGVVELVGFKRYVAVVMASGEWPSSLPVATLEAGAQATKQYGWYYALEGNHRDGNVNANGKCYDVRDDSQDQVYRPESSEPTDKQKDARDALWGLSLRKNDKFFLTGYRQGSSAKCGADADEWKLYATSATDCANQGLDSIEILHTYYSPKLTKTWAEGTEPEPDEPEPVEGAPDEESSDEQEPIETEPADDSAEAEPSTEPEVDEAEAADDAAGPIRSMGDRIRSLFGWDSEE